MSDIFQGNKKTGTVPTYDLTQFDQAVLSRIPEEFRNDVLHLVHTGEVTENTTRAWEIPEVGDVLSELFIARIQPLREAIAALRVNPQDVE